MPKRRIAGQSDYYVYVLMRPDTGEPFYVGKGFGKRMFQHEKSARKGEKSHKANLIRKFLRDGQEIRRTVIEENLTEVAAFILEREAITEIGRYPHGSLTNLTDGGDGSSGTIVSESTRRKIAASQQGRPLSEAHRKAISVGHTGKGEFMSREMRQKVSEAGASVSRNSVSRNSVWATNGILTKRVLSGSALPVGWILGRGSLGVFITDGAANKRVTDVSAIPSGWQIGRIRRRRDGTYGPFRQQRKSG